MITIAILIVTIFWFLFPQLLHLSEGVSRNIQKRFVRDRDAWKRVLQSFGIIEPKRAKIKLFLIFLEFFRKSQ